MSMLYNCRLEQEAVVTYILYTEEQIYM